MSTGIRTGMYVYRYVRSKASQPKVLHKFVHQVAAGGTYMYDGWYVYVLLPDVAIVPESGTGGEKQRRRIHRSLQHTLNIIVYHRAS